MADVDWAGFAQRNQQNSLGNQLGEGVQKFAQGFQIGGLMRQNNALNQARELEAKKEQQLLARTQALQTTLGDLSKVTDPYERVQGLNNVMLQFPEVADKLKTQAGFYSDQVKENATNALLPALNALNLGNKDVAINRLTTAAEAFKNSGNTRGAEALNAYIDDIKGSTEVAPLVQSGYLTLASILGPDKLADTLKNSQEYAKTQATQGSDISKVASEATIKFEEAKQAPLQTAIKAEEAARAPIETAIKEQEQVIKTAEAGVAGEKQALDIANARANLALTNQQRLVAVANAKKVNAEVEKLTKAVATGKIDISDPKDRFDFETKLRAERSKETTDFKKVRDANDRIETIYSQYLKPNKEGKVVIPKGETKDSAQARQAAGDIGLIFNYMKMLDPGSTVREGEFATAANATGVDGKVINLYNKIASGERLTPEQRGAYYKQSKGLYDKAKKRADEVDRSIGVVVDNYGLNKDNVLGTVKGAVTRVK